jgi:hypothetical protein
MADDHFRCIELNLPIVEFHRLPQNSAYKYEYFGGRAVLSPRPKCHCAVLDLHLLSDVETCDVRPLPPGEIVEMADLFGAAFHRTQPFASLDEDDARKAARACLEKTAGGGDGPLIGAACFQAFAERFDGPVGAILITLLPHENIDGWRSYTWKEPPPPDAVERRLGCPHLTWVFVSPWEVRRGVGTALLAASIRALMELGYPQLASTFLLGNDSSTLWHWRNGFRLQPLYSAMRREFAARAPTPRPRAAGPSGSA